MRELHAHAVDKRKVHANDGMFPCGSAGLMQSLKPRVEKGVFHAHAPQTEIDAFFVDLVILFHPKSSEIKNKQTQSSLLLFLFLAFELQNKSDKTWSKSELMEVLAETAL